MANSARQSDVAAHEQICHQLRKQQSNKISSRLFFRVYRSFYLYTGSFPKSSLTRKAKAQVPQRTSILPWIAKCSSRNWKRCLSIDSAGWSLVLCLLIFLLFLALFRVLRLFPFLARSFPVILRFVLLLSKAAG